MTVSELIDLLRAYDPEASVMVPCAVEEDGGLSLTANVCVQPGEGQDFEAVDKEGEVVGEDRDYLVIMPKEGPWVEGGFKLADDYNEG